METMMVAIGGRHEPLRLAATAATVAEPRTAIDVVHVREPGEPGGTAEAEAAVGDALALLRANGHVAEGHVLPAPDGDVAARLAACARACGAELVVMGSRGLGDLTGLVEHSVSHRLLAEIDLPVLVLPAHGRVPQRGCRRVLAAAGSEGDAGPIVAAALLLPQPVDVLVVHVPRRLAVHVGGDPAGRFLEIGETSTHVLAETSERLERAGIRATLRTLERTRGVGETVARAARVWEADVILVGPRRPGEWAAIAGGSTTHDVMRSSDRPVLIAGGEGS